MEIITLPEVKFLAHRLAKEMMDYNEPIPDFVTRYPNVLESSLAVPFQEFGGRPAYRGLIGKASILFYLMIKNHPFQNGNKRIAMTTLLVFLYKNHKWLKVDRKNLYNFAVWVAESPAEFKDEVLRSIEKYLTKNVVTDPFQTK